MTFCSLELLDLYYAFNSFILFQITMPKCHKTYPNCIWHVPSEWQGLNFDSALLTKVYWNYASASLLKQLITVIFPLPRKVFFKFTLALKQWLVCTTFSVTILLPLRIHSLKKNSVIFLQVSTFSSSITLLTNTPRMMNQSILLTCQSLHSTLTIQLTFLKYLKIAFIFSCNSKIFTTETGTRQ